MDEVGIAEALQTISVADIARRSGRSERTFWNHFATWDSYVEALVSRIPRRGPMESADDHGAVETVNEVLVATSRAGFPDLVRAAAEGNWLEVTREPELRAFRRQIFLASRTDPDNHLAEVLGRDYYGVYLPALQEIYEHFGSEVGATPIEPFDFEDLTRLLAALSEGLLLQFLATPEMITTEFVSDATAAVALSLLRRSEAGSRLASLEAEMAFDPGPVSGDAALVRDARRCADLVEQRHGALTWSEVADVLGSGERAVRDRFQRIGVLAALAFGTGAGAERSRPVEEGLDEHMRRRLTGADCLCGMVRRARKQPFAASQLLAERLLGGDDTAVVAQLVPLGQHLAAAMGETGGPVHERIVNVALAVALSDRSTSPAEVAEAGLVVHDRMSG